MGILDKGLTTSLSLMTKSPNKKQKAKFAITDITNQDLRKFLNKYKNLTKYKDSLRNKSSLWLD